ncbi:MAG TPA: hypothetical protein PKM63_03295 [Panacibacter sp.]|nr:hypothetical protein [Panacibacter sp.]HNP43284.1 hypothetical protein [Panacibacter sp.]
MKIFVGIFLLLIYSVSSTGMTLHFHYCCGKIDKIDLSPVKKDNCPEKKHIDSKSCCDDRHIELKIKDSYQNDAAVKNIDKLLVADSHIDHGITAVISLITNETLSGPNNSPPLLHSTGYQQLYCIYRL